jgi:hypothetical protein
MWSRFYKRFGSLSNPANLERCLATMLAQKAIQELRPEPERIRREFSQGLQTYERLFELFYKQTLERTGKRRWGDQLGLVERFADVIFSAYPEAKMIHMIRDPRDRSGEDEYKKSQTRRQCGWLTARWLFSAHLARSNSEHYRNQYMVVRYEDLMRNTDRTLRKICDFLHEDYLDAMLEAFTAERRTDDDERTENHKDGRASDMKTQITFTQLFARRDLINFGYTIEPVALSASERIRFSMIDLPASLAGLLAWNLVDGRQFRRSSAVKEG